MALKTAASKCRRDQIAAPTVSRRAANDAVTANRPAVSVEAIANRLVANDAAIVSNHKPIAVAISRLRAVTVEKCARSVLASNVAKPAPNAAPIAAWNDAQNVAVIASRHVNRGVRPSMAGVSAANVAQWKPAATRLIQIAPAIALIAMDVVMAAAPSDELNVDQIAVQIAETLTGMAAAMAGVQSVGPIAAIAIGMADVTDIVTVGADTAMVGAGIALNVAATAKATVPGIAITSVGIVSGASTTGIIGTAIAARIGAFSAWAGIIRPIAATAIAGSA